MNCRRTSKKHLGMGTVVLLVTSMVLMGGAGVFHVYLKNRQIHVAREIHAVEERISQHELDITNLEVRLDDQLNPILINDRLAGASSDLQRIPLRVVKEVPLLRERPAAASSGRAALSSPAPARSAPFSSVVGGP